MFDQRASFIRRIFDTKCIEDHPEHEINSITGAQMCLIMDVVFKCFNLLFRINSYILVTKTTNGNTQVSLGMSCAVYI